MLRVALRDLAHRRRRVAVAVAGAGMVFALSLVVSGLASSFVNEVKRTDRLLGVDTWVVPATASGPFTTLRPLPEAATRARLGGDEQIGGLLFSQANLGSAERPIGASVIGIEPGRTGAPVAVDGGRPVAADGEAVVSSGIGLGIGDTLVVHDVDLTVVGLADATLLAGTPLLIVTLADAQRAVAAGQPVVTAFASSSPLTVDDGFRTVSASVAVDDALRPLANAERTIALVRTMLWFVAALIIGSVLYLTALERTPDIAVFKAMGIRGPAIVAGMILQAVVIGLAAALVAAAVGLLLAPVFPLRAEISTAALMWLPAIAVVMSLLGAFAGAQRAMATPASRAFGGG